jgi:RAB protein geranylgeranyltransferase component A
MTDTDNEVVPLDKLARIYRRIRAEITTLTQEYDTKVEALKAQQEELKNAMKDQMKAMGVTSVRTPEGTVVMSVKTVYDTNDWDSFKQFVVANDAVDLLQKRIAQTNMKQFLEENPGLVPPGLNSRAEYDISVRKPT